MNLVIPYKIIEKINKKLAVISPMFMVLGIAVVVAVLSSLFSLRADTMVAYGDTESHLNIAKRVIHSLTPGVAQLGGIWLPLPHLMLVPFVSIDFLWRTGLAGAIVSGICFVVSSVLLYKFGVLVMNSKTGGVVASLLFIFNPNIMYLQSTAMTELPLIMFFLLSTYFFIKFLKGQNEGISLIFASMCGFCAVLTRYDGWFLVVIQTGIIFLVGIVRRWKWHKIEGTIVHFCTFAFFGIVLWMMWDFLILGNPFYFTQSQFSAHAQQEGWLAKGQLPAYRNVFLSFAYYFITSMSNAGFILFFVSILGLLSYLKNRNDSQRFFVAMVLMVPFVFYVFTLYVGQSIIFIPHLTPITFEWRLFNVRYGVMMIPVVAFFFGYIFSRAKLTTKFFLVFLCFIQLTLFGIGYSKVLSYEDGVAGLSQSKRPDAERWLAENYDDGLVLLDDYSRLISIIRSSIPMQNTIYIGNEPYWEESLQAPEKYAKWIIVQKDDSVWDEIYVKPEMQGRLYKYFQKVYTSPEILIFKRIERIEGSTQ